MSVRPIVKSLLSFMILVICIVSLFFLISLTKKINYHFIDSYINFIDF